MTQPKMMKIAKTLTMDGRYAKKTEKVSIPELPEGIELKDMEYPSYKATGKNKLAYNEQHHAQEFELWYSTGFGWCIPTLSIAKRQTGVNKGYSGGERTYAARVSDGQTVRIGNGPHVVARLKIYVRVGRLAKLEKFLALQNDGASNANTIRDRISTHRAQTAARRFSY